MPNTAEKMIAPGLAPKGSAQMEAVDGHLRFTVLKSPPHNFRHKRAIVRSYLEAEGRYRLPLKIDLTVALDAPGFCVMLGEFGRVHFCSTWDDCRRIEDITEPPATAKSRVFANQMPLSTPVHITIIYNLKSMQVLMDGRQRYYSAKERYMKSPAFPALNEAGFPLRLTCKKRTEVCLYDFTITESEEDFEVIRQEDMPDPVLCNIPLRPGDAPKYENILAALGGKPTFEAVIACLPDGVRERVVEMDGFLRAYKPIKFRRSIEKNGNKITYLASQAGVSYMINVSRDMLTHTLEWYILFNGKENWGKRKADDLVKTLEKLSETDPAFADRMFSYLKDCTGCYGPGCGGRSPYTFNGHTKQTCHGKIEFKMAPSEFDDARRLIEAIG